MGSLSCLRKGLLLQDHLVQKKQAAHLQDQQDRHRQNIQDTVEKLLADHMEHEAGKFKRIRDDKKGRDRYRRDEKQIEYNDRNALPAQKQTDPPETAQDQPARIDRFSLPQVLRQQDHRIQQRRTSQKQDQFCDRKNGIAMPGAEE